MLTLEQATYNVVFTKGLFSVDISAFQFDWAILNRIFVSTFHKYERFCPQLKTVQLNGGNPVKMPDDCLYPRAIGFGNPSMIPPQTVTVDRQSWSYNRQTNVLSVFTNTGSSAPFQVQYIARYSQIDVESDIPPFEVFDGETDIEIHLDNVPNPSTLKISKGESTLEITSRDRYCWKLSGTLGTAELDLTTLTLKIAQTDTTAGEINVAYTGNYKAFDFVTDDVEFFETWYAANILSSLGNIKAVLRVDAMPNDINADNLISQGKELQDRVLDFQKEKSAWWLGYISARV